MAEKHGEQQTENSIYLSRGDNLAFIDGRIVPPGRSQKVFNHSPDGFAWGYAGSGPAQLALAILLEFADEQTAVRLHQHFKSQVIAVLPQDRDANIKLDVRAWIEKANADLVGA